MAMATARFALSWPTMKRSSSETISLGEKARMKPLKFFGGEIGVGESIIIESIIGSTFSVKVDEITTFGKYEAVIPEVRGTAFLTGKNTFWINPNDPLKDGFILR